MKKNALPFLSVVIPTFRRPELLRRCLRALLEQDIDPSWFEIIVCDDGPDEATRALVLELAAGSSQPQAAESQAAISARLRPMPFVSPVGDAGDGAEARNAATMHDVRDRPRRLPDVRYLPVAPGHGPCGPAHARNRGWCSAQGMIIAFTDDDTVPAPDWLHNGWRALHQTDAVAVSGHILVTATDDDRWSPLHPAVMRGAHAEMGAAASGRPPGRSCEGRSRPGDGRKWLHRPTDHERNVAQLERAEFATANVFVWRDALVAAGGFDERYRRAWREDSDLHFALLGLGRVGRVHDARVLHPVRPARWGESLRTQSLVRYDVLLYRKHPQLFRRHIRARPPWLYGFSTLAIAAAAAGLLGGMPALAAAGSVAWAGVTLWFAAARLRRTSLRPAHIAEMLVTSALIPPLAIFWRLVGAVRYRTFFVF